MIRDLLILNLFFQLCLQSVLTFPQCDMVLTETMIDDMPYANNSVQNVPTWQVWSDLIKNSNNSIKIASFYWSLLSTDINTTKPFTGSQRGEKIFGLLNEKSKNVALEVVQNSGPEQPNLQLLQKNECVKTHYINFGRLIKKGIQHAKVWIGDDSRAYIGSANMDTRSLSVVKELGVYIPDCKTIVSDVDKFWQAFRLLSGPNATIPKEWPESLIPSFNHTHPLTASVNGVLSRVYIAASPPAFNTPYRTDDLTSVLRTISQAKKYVCISVMNMLPLKVGYGKEPDVFWPLIENELKKSAIESKVSVKLLISWWSHSQKKMLEYLRSLKTLSNITNVDIQVKIFTVPGYDNNEILHSRVSHNKYMVTDNTAYIGTSNWSGDYFEYTGGLSIIAEDVNPGTSNDKSIREQLKKVFDRDWNSNYANSL